MKKLTIILFTVFVVDSYAQEEVPKDQKDHGTSPSAYFSFDTKIAGLRNDRAIYTGIRFGFTANQKYTFGIAGYELSGDNSFIFIDKQGDLHNFKNEVEYGGLFVENTLWNRRPFRLTSPFFVGGGKTIIKENVPLHQYAFEDANNRENGYWATVEDSRFFVIESGLTLELDLAKWARLGVGTSYRTVAGNDLQSFVEADKDQSGFSFDLNFKLSCF